MTNGTNGNGKKPHWGKIEGGPLEQNREVVLVSLVIEGTPRAKVAAQYKVSVEAVRQFLVRHADEVTAYHNELLKSVMHIPITQKFHRLRYLNWMLEKLMDTLDQRAQQWQDTGLVAREPRWVGGKEGELVWLERIDTGAIHEFRALLHDAAAQLGQLPKPDFNVTINETTIEYTQIQQNIAAAIGRLEAAVPKGKRRITKP